MLKLKAIISEVMIVEEAAITKDSNYQSIENWDSLSQVTLIAKIEKATQERFSPKEIAEMTSVQNIVHCLQGKGIQCEGIE